MSIERKVSKIEKAALITPIKAYIKMKYNLEVDRNDTVGLKPPYLILGNHVTDWDPLFINSYVEEPICFVASASAFRKPLMKKVLNYAGAIPKTKSRTDTSTIRNILKAKKANRVIGLFPEGNRNWNGLPEPVFYSTVKLMKSLNIPIVVANIRGGYLSHPRWADEARKGKIVMSLRKVWDAGDLKEMTHDEIFDALKKELFVDDFEWNKSNRVKYKGRHLAEGLERYLFMCPSCREIHSLHSSDDEFACEHCGYTVRYNEFGLFEEGKKPLVFEYIYEWNDWQIRELQAMYRDEAKRGELQRKLAEPIDVSKTAKDGTTVEMGKFDLSIETDCLRLASREDQSVKMIPIDEIDGTNIFKQLVLNFFYEEQHYHLTLLNKRGSAYLWLQYILCAQLAANPERDMEF